MGEQSRPRDRMHALLDLARVYRGWSRAQLARALDRDPTKIYSQSDDPKLSVMVALADVLEWSIDAVAEYIWAGIGGDRAEPLTNGHAAASFETLFAETTQAYALGEFARTVELARRMLATAQTPAQRAEALNKESLGWDGLGRHTKALNAIRQALHESPLPQDQRLVLQSNLANAHYTLWELASARGIAESLTDWFKGHPPVSRRQRATHAFALYVRGSSSRRLMAAEPEFERDHAERAKEDLTRTVSLYEELSREFGRPDYACIANTCRAGVLEADAALGIVQPEAALARLLDQLDAVADVDALSDKSMLESFGWTCIFGANIALRHVTGGALQRYVSVFTNKALEIANKLDNWAFRERVFAFEYMLRERLARETGVRVDLAIDDHDIRMITGAMGRFPSFRRMGWDILHSAKVVKDARRN